MGYAWSEEICCDIIRYGFRFARPPLSYCSITIVRPVSSSSTIKRHRAVVQTVWGAEAARVAYIHIAKLGALEIPNIRPTSPALATLV